MAASDSEPEDKAIRLWDGDTLPGELIGLTPVFWTVEP